MLDVRTFGHKLTQSEYDTLIHIRRLVGGSVQYFHEADIKMGPRSFDELSAWPDLMLVDFMEMPNGRARLARVLAILENGLAVHTDCSGKMTPEAVLLMLAVALRHQGFQLRDDWLGLWRASDLAPECQEFIRNSTHRPMHLFNDFMGRQPHHAQIQLKHLRALPGASLAQREIAHNTQVAYLEENKISLSQAFTGRNCLFHPDKDCKVNFTVPQCLDKPPMTMCIVGLPCRPFSTLGDRQQLAHGDMEAIALFKIEILKGDYDIVVIEESDHFPWELFCSLFPAHYVLRRCVFGPTDQGKPVRRTRFWGAAVNQKRAVWIGPESNDMLQQDFLSLFGAACQLDGDVYCKKDSQEGIKETVNVIAKRAGKYSTDEQLADCDNWQTFLPQGFRSTFDAATALWKGEVGEGRSVGMSGTMLADLSQSPHRCRQGPWVPTIARSSLLCSLSSHHILTPAELDFAMGWPSIETKHNRDYAEALGLSGSLSGASSSVRRKLSGNGMDMGSVMAWFLYIFSNVMRKSVLEKLEMPLSKQNIENMRDDSDDELLSFGSQARKPHGSFGSVKQASDFLKASFATDQEASDYLTGWQSGAL